MVDPTKDHRRTSPAGREMGRNAARLAELGASRMAAAGLTDMNVPTVRDKMCKSCACRPGTVPNGCLDTQLDILKAAAEGTPFYCHAPRDGRMCAGWIRIRAQVVATPFPAPLLALLAKHEFSPPDEEPAR